MIFFDLFFRVAHSRIFSIIFGIELIYKILSKKSNLFLCSFAATMNGLHDCIHILLWVEFHFLLFWKWGWFFISLIAFICDFSFHLIFDHGERFIRAVERRFWSVLILDVIAFLINFEAKKFDPANSSKVVFGQEFFKEYLSLFADVIDLKGKLNVACIDSGNEHGDWFGLIGANSEQHLIEDYS